MLEAGRAALSGVLSRPFIPSRKSRRDCPADTGDVLGLSDIAGNLLMMTGWGFLHPAADRCVVGGERGDGLLFADAAVDARSRGAARWSAVMAVIARCSSSRSSAAGDPAARWMWSMAIRSIRCCARSPASRPRDLPLRGPDADRLSMTRCRTRWLIDHPELRSSLPACMFRRPLYLLFGRWWRCSRAMAVAHPVRQCAVYRLGIISYSIYLIHPLFVSFAHAPAGVTSAKPRLAYLPHPRSVLSRLGCCRKRSAG